MRVLFTSQPGYGHLTPTLGYAQTLREAGHEVRVATAPAFCAVPKDLGFDTLPAGADFVWERVREYFPEVLKAGSEGRDAEFVADITWRVWNPAMASDLLRAFEKWRPDLIVREWAEDGATIAGELAEIPVACAAWGALPGDRVFKEFRLVERHDALRGKFGLTSNAAEAWATQTVLSSFPRSWFGDDGDRSGRVHHIRMPPFDRRDDFDAPPFLEEMGRQRPLIYATLGTVYGAVRHLRRILVEALSSIGADVLFTTGPAVDPTRVRPPDPRVRVQQFVPQSLVLPRARLVVSHAGLGTVLGALYAGVPMVLLTLGADHPVNAARAEGLGIARTIDVTELSTERLQSAVSDCIADEGRAARAEAVSRECEAMLPLADVVPILETLAAGH